MDGLQRQADPQEMRAITGGMGGDGTKAALPSDWFIWYYRACFPKYAQDREYWPEIETILREQFLKRGDGPIWRSACNGGKEAMKTPSVFTTIEDYRERVNAKARAAETDAALTAKREPMDPEIRELIEELNERLALRGAGSSKATPALRAALILRTIADAKAKGISKDRIVFHTMDMGADAVQGG